MIRIKNNCHIFSLILFLTAGLLAPLGVLGAQASFFVAPSSKSYIVGQIFTVALNVSADLAVNAVEGSLVYPTDKLEALSVSKASSIIGLWINEPIISPNSGNVYFAGVILNPGYKGTGVRILSVNFRVKAPGDAFITVSNGSALANDGLGTQILSRISGGRYKLEPKISTPTPLPEPVELPPPAILQLFSPTHPDPGKWYANDRPRLEWVLPPKTENISFILDNLPTTIPDIAPKGVSEFYEAKNLKSGIWYFHLRVLKNKKWSEPAHFQIKIDTDPPEEFKIDFFDEEETFNAKPKIFFGTKDQLSGIDHYILKIDDGDEFVLPASVGEKPFLLPKQPYGKVSLTIKAYDEAGNFFSVNGSINIVSRLVQPARALFDESVLFWIIVVLLTLTSVMLLAVTIIPYFKHQKRK